MDKWSEMLLLIYSFSYYCDPSLYKRICYFLLGELSVDLDQGNRLGEWCNEECVGCKGGMGMRSHSWTT